MKQTSSYTPIFIFGGISVVLVLIFLIFFKTPDFMPISNQKISYRFNDSSVPPEYHRSYDLTLTDSKIRLVVDSYGDVLKDKSFNIDNDTTKKFFENIESYNLKTNEYPDFEMGCPGGTSEELKIYDINGELTLDAKVYHCGENDSANFSGDFDELVSEMKSLVPDLEKLTE